VVTHVGAFPDTYLDSVARNVAQAASPSDATAFATLASPSTAAPAAHTRFSRPPAASMLDACLNFQQLNVLTPIAATLLRTAIYAHINECLVAHLRGRVFLHCTREFSINIMEACVKRGHAILREGLVQELAYRDAVYTSLIEHPVGSFLVKHVFNAAQG
jgi:hypothetical protein